MILAVGYTHPLTVSDFHLSLRIFEDHFQVTEYFFVRQERYEVVVQHRRNFLRWLVKAATHQPVKH